MKHMLAVVFSSFLVLFIVSLSPQAGASPIVYFSESDFLNDAPIVSTETFDDWTLPAYFYTPVITINEVIYETDGPCTAMNRPNPCWYVEPRPDASTPNLFGATFGWEGLTRYEHRISFGIDQYVMAYGFWFQGGGSIHMITVEDMDGTVTTFVEDNWEYIGFLSDTGIRSLTVFDDTSDGDIGTPESQAGPYPP